jgi:uncharacterized protein YdaU (DUF1376 family)
MTNAWYAHYPGDYGRDTAHLTMIQHGAYRQLLDHYYGTAVPLPSDATALYRICRAFDQAERDAVDFVLSEFFDLREDGYHNARADLEIAKRVEHHERLAAGAQKTNQRRWGSRSATRLAIRSALASPQPQPQSQSDPKAKKTPAAKPAPPADPRFQPFLDFAFGAFEAKHGQKPAWNGKDFKALSTLLANNKGLGADELQRRFGNYLASTEPFTQKQGGSLAYFCARIDSFLAGPITVGLLKGKTNAKPSVNDNIETTLHTMRAAEQSRPN